ncbi:MAG: SdiA-regulated domain-containing protein, partial [Campylobacterota bacterium]|nr:SdiA-regulated domain-containing protein [Campylobacterota bacterium]
MNYIVKKVFYLVLFIFVVVTNGHSKKIANIPEASGICFIDKTKSIVVVNDEGWIYKLTTNGKIVQKKYLGKYDLEGITYDKKNDRLLVVVEGEESILIVQRGSLQIVKEIKIKRSYQKVKILKKSKKTGIEAIAIDNDGEIYVSNQSKKTYNKKLKENISVILKVTSLDNKKTKIKEVFNHGYIDIAGMTFHNGYLYMTSDKKNLLIKYDIKNNKTIAKIKLPKSAQEGICFDNKNNIYIADDNGAILRYKK